MSRESQASGGCVYSAPSLRATSFLFFLLSSFFFAFSAGPGNQIHRRRHAGGCPAKKGPPRRRWRGGSAYVLPRPRTIETSPFRSPCFFFLRRSIFSRLSSRRAESATNSSRLLRVHHERRLHATRPPVSTPCSRLCCSSPLPFPISISSSPFPLGFARVSRACTVVQSGFLTPFCATTSLTDTRRCVS